MERSVVVPRKNWQKKVESVGLTFHSRDSPYWTDDVCYRFTGEEVDTLERAANEIHELCREAARYIIERNLFETMHIGSRAAELIGASWQRNEKALYGRFDFLYDGTSQPKMIEYNADTPTSLLEAAVVQWYWLKDQLPEADQFNSIHEGLVAQWGRMGITGRLHLSALSGVEEDVMTVAYLQDTAERAGIQSTYLDVEKIGYNPSRGFVDEREQEISTLFKLYPWECMVDEQFGQHLTTSNMRIIEPAWKMLWSNKALLAVLWDIAPNHPNLLEAHLDEPSSGEWVEKPIFGREGQNVKIRTKAGTMSNEGTYGGDPMIFQRFHYTRAFDGKHPVLGVWMIGEECRGMGIRESDRLITDNKSRFVPHYFI